MDINDMTIRQAKELTAIFGGNSADVRTVAHTMVGKYAIIRSRNEGINAGLILAADHTGVVLGNARRLWHHRPKVTTESWYEGVANHGLSSDSRVSGVATQKAIIEDYSVTVCSDEARQSIEAAVAHAQP